MLLFYGIHAFSCNTKLSSRLGLARTNDTIRYLIGFGSIPHLAKRAIRANIFILTTTKNTQ